MSKYTIKLDHSHLSEAKLLNYMFLLDKAFRTIVKLATSELELEAQCIVL